MSLKTLKYEAKNTRKSERQLFILMHSPSRLFYANKYLIFFTSLFLTAIVAWMVKLTCKKKESYCLYKRRRQFTIRQQFGPIFDQFLCQRCLWTVPRRLKVLILDWLKLLVDSVELARIPWNRLEFHLFTIIHYVVHSILQVENC